jgi:hypothetical protein
VDRQGGKNREYILKTMVQAIDAERVWGYYIHRRQRIPDRTYRARNLLCPQNL